MYFIVIKTETTSTDAKTFMAIYAPLIAIYYGKMAIKAFCLLWAARPERAGFSAYTAEIAGTRICYSLFYSLGVQPQPGHVSQAYP